MRPRTSAFFLPLALAAVWARAEPPACLVGDNSCGQWKLSAGGIGMRWEAFPASMLKDPYADEQPADAPKTDQPRDGKTLKEDLRQTNLEKWRARRREIDRVTGEKARQKGVVVDDHGDIVNFRKCETGDKGACDKLVYEKTGDGSQAPRPAAKRPKKKRTPGAAGAAGGGGGAGASAGESEDEVEATDGAEANSPPEGTAGGEETAQRGAAAMKSASALGGQINEARADSLPGGPAGGGAAAAPQPETQAQVEAKPGGGELNFAAAAASGFGASFAEAGLKMGTGADAGRVLRADGQPASGDDLARLRGQIDKDPEALMRRPDLFNVIDRAKVNRLKNDYKTMAGEREGAFKHIGLTKGDRDLVRTQSCNLKLDKGCNRLARKPYKKGEFVPPEDLAAIDKLLHSEGDEDEEEEEEEADEDEQIADSASASGVASTTFGRIKRRFWSSSAERPRASRKTGAGPRKARPRGVIPPSPAPTSEKSGRGLWAWGLGAAAVALFVLIALKRKRKT